MTNQRDETAIRLDLACGQLCLIPLTDHALRVRWSRGPAPLPPSYMLRPPAHPPRFEVHDGAGYSTVALPGLTARVEHASGRIAFFDARGDALVEEGSRRIEPTRAGGQPAFAVEQAFRGPAGERLFGGGQFQDGLLDLKGATRRLTQVNTQVSVPFFLSSKGYGLLWHNNGLTELNPLDDDVELVKAAEDARGTAVRVTTTHGSEQQVRHEATFTGRLRVARPGTFSLLLDVGRRMATRYRLEIDGVVLFDLANGWLPPTTSVLAHLEAGEHAVRVTCERGDAPRLWYGPAGEETVLRSPAADAVDYVIVAGRSGADVLAQYRLVTGAAPLPPLWAFGYIHCRDRFTSQDELLTTAREFRRRGLPVDVMVQDWQYWGRHGWNAMRFDEQYYPDPAQMVRELHDLGLRLMLSVWPRIDRASAIGAGFAAKGYYIEGTDWVDFFDERACDHYWRIERENLLSLGVDAFWQDAAEPENDDLQGRVTAAGPGETVRVVYPLQVARAVYRGQRRDAPRRRVFTLIRSTSAGGQRYGAAVWSGDVGNDWETLRRQITAGLNFVAAGVPYWTVDAGGFFRPGADQYRDPDYHERFVRWFQYATFLPLLRVHGYQTDTEPWRFGEMVEQNVRRFLDVRYRLLPYIYGEAAAVTHHGSSLMRPLVMDFGEDERALGERYTYMFGRSLHIAPVHVRRPETWPVYLPRAAGGWHDFWTGRRRSGGALHTVPVTMDRIPVHVRAGSILPLAPAALSTAKAHWDGLEIRVFAGADGRFTLYEDDGTSYDYEHGAHSRIDLSWNERDRSLSISAPRGHFPGMLARRTFTVTTPGGPTATVEYDGTPVTVALAPQRS